MPSVYAVIQGSEEVVAFVATQKDNFGFLTVRNFEN